MTDSGFIMLPLVSFLCNAFLFITVASAKRSKQNCAFLLLLGSFVLWTAGSLFMRLAIYPGMHFWYDVSSLGVFLVPFCVYFFLYCFTNRRAPFSLIVCAVIWLALIVCNQLYVFIQNPRILTAADGALSFDYDLTWYAVIPIVAAFFTLLSAGHMIYRNIRRDGTPVSYFRPIFIGCAIMFVGLFVQSVFGIDGLNSDTIFCGINAVCLYNVLYKKRLLTLMPLASNGPVYFMAMLCMLLVCGTFYPQIDAFYTANFAEYVGSKAVVYACVFSLLTLVIVTILQKLMKKIFVEGQEMREQELKQFSSVVSRSLDTAEIIDNFMTFLRENCTAELVYMCMHDESEQRYVITGCTRDIQAKDFSLPADAPLVRYMERTGHSVRYAEFCRTRDYRSMWEAEKASLRDLGAELILPIAYDEKLIGFAIFVAKGRKPFLEREVSFLESASSILAIALMNASLYAKMHNEARRDALTGLYNRGYFIRQLPKDLALSRHDRLTVLLISMDDFRLYNELYTVAEGDIVLCAFARILEKVVDGRGLIARYGGKEFVVSLPFCDPRTARSIAEECRALLNQHVAKSEDKMRKFLTFSAGISNYPTAATNPDELISYANMAVYMAKKYGKNRTVVYTRGDDAAGGGRDTATALLREQRDNSTQTIFALAAAIDAKDHYTFDHSNNVSRYASTLAHAIGLDQEHVEMIRQAGLLHDIGKIGIPEAILTKEGRLTDEEFEIMKQHVEGSIAMIRYLPSLDYVIPAAIGHHERWDGHGYPRGIAGENIPIGARCLCLADAFDAMTTRRPYRDPMPVEKALEEIERSLGTQFDPVLGRRFIELVRRGEIRLEQKRKEPSNE